MRRSFRRVSVLVIALAGGLFATIHAAAAETVENDGIRVVSIVDGEPVGGGASDAPFELALPPEASCPGDSMHDDWRVQSFVVPDSVDLGSLRYESIKPAGEGNWPLVDAGGNAVMQELLLPNQVAGQPGRIDRLPTLSFAAFPPGTLPDGRYRIGIACTLMRETAVFWSVAIDVIGDAAGGPARFRWSVVDAVPDAASADPPSNSNWIARGLVAAGLGLAVWLAVALLPLPFRRRSVRLPDPDDPRDDPSAFSGAEPATHPSSVKEPR